MAILSVVIAATLTQPPRKFIQWKKRIKRDAGRAGGRRPHIHRYISRYGLKGSARRL